MSDVEGEIGFEHVKFGKGVSIPRLGVSRQWLEYASGAQITDLGLVIDRWSALHGHDGCWMQPIRGREI